MQNSPAEVFWFIQLRPPRPAGEVESIALSRTDFARMLADIDGKTAPRASLIRPIPAGSSAGASAKTRDANHPERDP